MKRTPEFILGLIGSLFAIAINGFFIIFIGLLPVRSDLYGTWIFFWLSLALSIAALVFACLVNDKTKLSGIALIVLSISIIFFHLSNIVPAILLLIAGTMSLVRPLPKLNENFSN